jgi:hypothetical protein
MSSRNVNLGEERTFAGGAGAILLIIAGFHE